MTKLHTRKQAAGFITEHGFPMTARTLEKKPVPYVVCNGWSMYGEADLLAYIAKQLSAAPRRTGGIGRGHATSATSPQRVQRDTAA